MIRGGTSLARIAGVLTLCAAWFALVIPAAAGAQSAVDEYTLDIPSSGNNPGSSGGDAGASAAGTGAGSGGGSGSNRSGVEGSGGDGQGRDADREGDDLGLGSLGEGGTGSSVDPGSRSAPAVVADTLADSAMLPVIAVLLLITGLGAWRVLRGRGMLTGESD